MEEFFQLILAFIDPSFTETKLVCIADIHQQPVPTAESKKDNGYITLSNLIQYQDRILYKVPPHCFLFLCFIIENVSLNMEN